MATAPAAVSANKAELIAIADAVAREKLIDKGIVIEAMEDAIQRAARARYGAENDIRAKLDARNRRPSPVARARSGRRARGSFQADRRERRAEAAEGRRVGDFIVDPLPPIEFGRIAAQAAKQVIFQKVRDAERERQYEEFKDRVERGHHRRRQARRVRPRRRRPRPRRGRHPPRPADPARNGPRRRPHPLADHARRAAKPAARRSSCPAPTPTS